MRLIRAIGALAGAFTLASGTSGTPALAGTPLATTPAGAAATVAVHGTLVVVPSETPGGRAAYAVALAGGRLVRVRGHLAHARPLSRFSGTLTLPASVTRTLAARGDTVRTGHPLDATSASGRDALRLVDQGSLSLRVSGTASLTAPDTTTSPASHHVYVAALDGHGQMTQTDSQLLAHISTVATYWTGQAGGAISGITVPATVTHVGSAAATADCGLGGDFFSVAHDVEADFPGIDTFTGSDQLVVLVPPSCASGTIVGQGTVGAGFASGGVVIVKAGPGTEGVYAHETGHTFGFEHANAFFDGTSLQYLGLYDVMGLSLDGYNQLTALSTPLRVFQGITQAGEVQDVPLGGSPVHQTFAVKPRVCTSGLRSLRLVDPDTGRTVYVDYRSGTGQDLGAAYALSGGIGYSADGINLRYGKGLVISAPAGVGGIDDLTSPSGATSVPSGGSWSNASSTLVVRLGTADSKSASVTVDYTPPVPFTTLGSPVLTGGSAVGSTVSVDTGTWSPDPTAVHVRWLADGAPIPGTDDATQIVLGAAEVGQQVVARVTASRLGLSTTTASSTPRVVEPGAITVTTDPTVTGTPRVGSTLLGSPGAWEALQSPASSTWQWRADGADIPGATERGYVVQPTDLGKELSVVEHVTAQAYDATTAGSAETAPVVLGALDTDAPTIGGRLLMGRTLTARTGTWTAGTTFSFVWSASGTPIRGATARHLVLTRAQRGQRISVTVVGTHAGYAPSTRTSARTPRIA